MSDKQLLDYLVLTLTIESMDIHHDNGEKVIYESLLTRIQSQRGSINE